MAPFASRWMAHWKIASSSADRDIAAIDDALQTMAQIDPRKEKAVWFWFFGRLSVDETATGLKISPQSVMRDWKMARAWLMAELTR
jgi:RNA polymerase sigma-70 factor, ECF subfamily